MRACNLSTPGHLPAGIIVASAKNPWPIAAVAAYDAASDRLKWVEDRRQRANAPLFYGRELARNALCRARYAGGLRTDLAVQDEIRTVTRLAGDLISEDVLTRGHGVMISWAAHRDSEAGTIVRFLEVVNDDIISRRPKDRREAESLALWHFIDLEDRWANGAQDVVRDAFPIRRGRAAR